MSIKSLGGLSDATVIQIIGIKMVFQTDLDSF